MGQIQIKKLSLVTILSTFILTGCHLNSQYINRVEDKNEAEKITNQLFDLLKVKDYESASKLFSEKFYETTDKEKLFKIFTTTADKLGQLKNTQIEKWETKVVVGTNPSSYYAFIYKNQYEKFSANERIRLTKDEDGKIRILGYFINSDGFMNV